MPQRSTPRPPSSPPARKSTRRDPSQFQYVKLAIDKNVARITLARPDHNLLNESMLREIADAILTAGETETAKLIVLDSACKVFSGGDRHRGIHVAACVSDARRVSQRVRRDAGGGQAGFCVVNGPAIGGGTELALFGDLVVATPKARFAQPEITIGVFPPLASTILPYLVGPKVALEIILTGEPINAERALGIGFGQSTGARSRSRKDGR